MAASRESSRSRRPSDSAMLASPTATDSPRTGISSQGDGDGDSRDDPTIAAEMTQPVASTSTGTSTAAQEPPTAGEPAYGVQSQPNLKQQQQQQQQQPTHAHPPPPPTYSLWRDGVSYAHAPDLTHYLESTFVPSVVPQPDEYHAKDQARQYLEKLADQVSPGAKLLPFGSMANGFALKNSDMDLCCFLAKDAPVREPSELVEILGRSIEQETNFYVKMLPRARIPIIKLTIPPSTDVPMGMACDIGFENRLALENTRLLLTYAMIDSRLRTLVLFLKVWTKRRKINNPYRGTLSSYGYVLLVIQFLAHVKQPPVLPNLQRLSSPDGPAAEETIFDGHDISFFDDLDALPSLFQTTNTETSGELLIDFFRYFSKDFNFTHQVVSVRSDKGVLPKVQKGWHVDFEFDPELTVRDQHKLCVEDPFQLDYNVARTVTRDGLYTIRGEFMRAFRILTTPTRSPEGIGAVINSLCEEREDYLLIHPADDPTAHYNHRLYPGSPAHPQQRSPRRRSAPSPRMGPTAYGPALHHQPPHLGQSPVLGREHPFWNSMNGGSPMANGVGEHGAPRLGPAPVEGAGGADQAGGKAGGALAEPFHPGGQASHQPHLGRPPHPISEYPYGGRPPIQHASTPPTVAGSPPPPNALLEVASSSSSRERRQSWDGTSAGKAGSSTSGTTLNGGYDLHRFFQNPQQQPSSSSVSEVGGPTSSSMAAAASTSSTLNGRGTVSLTAPSSPDMMSQSAYFAGHPTSHYAYPYSGRSQHRHGPNGPTGPYQAGAHVGPRLATSVPRNPHTAHHAYTNPYASAPVPYPPTGPPPPGGSGYVTPTGYPLGGAASPVPAAAAALAALPPPPAPIFPEEDRQTVAMANNITFGSFPEMLPLPSYAQYHASGGSAAYLAGGGGWAPEPYGVSGPMRSGNRTHGPGGGPRRPIPRHSLSSTAENEHSGEEDIEEGESFPSDSATNGPTQRSTYRHPFPPLLGKDAPLSREDDDDADRAPRIRGRSAPHVRLGPDGRETLLFGAIEVTLPRAEDVEEAEQEEEEREQEDDVESESSSSRSETASLAAAQDEEVAAAQDEEVAFLGPTPTTDGGSEPVAATTDQIPPHAVRSIPTLRTQPPTPAKALGSPPRNALGLEDGTSVADSPTRPSRAGSRTSSPRRSLDKSASPGAASSTLATEDASIDAGAAAAQHEHERDLVNGVSSLSFEPSTPPSPASPSG